MISILEGLRAHLLGEHAIAAVVGARVFPLKLPQPKQGVTSYPAIQLQRISGVRFGTLNAVASLARPRYQVDCWGQTFQAATELGSLCRQRLDGFVGTWSDGSPGNTVSVSVDFEDERDLFEEDIGGGLYRHSADYFIFHGTDGGAL